MSNMKIGEVRAFKCVEAVDDDNRCEGCMFCDDGSFCWSDGDISGHCSTAFRDDKKDVIFVSTNPNEIIRKGVEEAIDRWSGNNDDRILSIPSNYCDCMIGLKAGYWKRLLASIMEMCDEDAVQD